MSYIRGAWQVQPIVLWPPNHQAAVTPQAPWHASLQKQQLAWSKNPVEEFSGCGGEFWPVPPWETLRANVRPLSPRDPLKSEGDRMFLYEPLSHLLMGWKDKVDTGVDTQPSRLDIRPSCSEVGRTRGCGCEAT